MFPCTSGSSPKPISSVKISPGLGMNVAGSPGLPSLPAAAATFPAVLTPPLASAFSSGWGSIRAMPINTAPIITSTIFGNPGTSTRIHSMMPVIITVRRLVSSWPINSSPSPVSDPDRVTKIPAAADINRAGIWETRPSPDAQERETLHRFLRTEIHLHDADDKAAHRD